MPQRNDDLDAYFVIAIVIVIVIVGAGSVMADHLSADGRHSVTLLEFGGSDRSILIQMPAALSTPMRRRRYNWFYESEPDPISAAAACTRPAEKCSAAPPPSTAWSMSAATRSISNPGRPRAPKAGAGDTC